MNASQIYIAIAIVVLAIIAILVFFINKSKKEKRLSKLASLSFLFVILGIISISSSITIFGSERIIPYSLMGIGVILAVIDIIIRKLKQK